MTKNHSILFAGKSHLVWLIVKKKAKFWRWVVMVEVMVEAKEVG